MTPITDPTALADQLSAAAREADRANRAMCATGHARLNYLTAPTPWLATKLAQLHAAIEDGTARGCPHINDGPRVAFATAWAPGLLACAHCAPMMTPDEAEDATCDKCRTRVPTIHPRSATIGPLIYAYGLCPQCASSEPDGHAPNRAARRHPARR
jgi:hypothetical protein